MFDPTDFRRLASRLLRNSKSDAADCRTAVSRLYYYVFLFARNYLEPHFIFSKVGAVHEEVQLLFQNASNPLAMQIAVKISALRAQRNTADYDLAHPDIGTLPTARLAEENTKRLAGEISELLSGDDAQAVISAMKSWAKMSSKPRPRS